MSTQKDSTFSQEKNRIQNDLGTEPTVNMKHDSMETSQPSLNDHKNVDSSGIEPTSTMTQSVAPLSSKIATTTMNRSGAPFSNSNNPLRSTTSSKSNRLGAPLSSSNPIRSTSSSTMTNRLGAPLSSSCDKIVSTTTTPQSVAPLSSKSMDETIRTESPSINEMNHPNIHPALNHATLKMVNSTTTAPMSASNPMPSTRPQRAAAKRGKTRLLEAYQELSYNEDTPFQDAYNRKKHRVNSYGHSKLDDSYSRNSSNVQLDPIVATKVRMVSYHRYVVYNKQTDRFEVRIYLGRNNYKFVGGTYRKIQDAVAARNAALLACHREVPTDEQNPKLSDTCIERQKQRLEKEEMHTILNDYDTPTELDTSSLPSSIRYDSKMKKYRVRVPLNGKVIDGGAHSLLRDAISACDMIYRRVQTSSDSSSSGATSDTETSSDESYVAGAAPPMSRANRRNTSRGRRKTSPRTTSASRTSSTSRTSTPRRPISAVTPNWQQTAMRPEWEYAIRDVSEQRSKVQVISKQSEILKEIHQYATSSRPLRHALQGAKVLRLVNV